MLKSYIVITSMTKLKFSKDLPTKLDFDELPTSELNIEWFMQT